MVDSRLQGTTFKFRELTQFITTLLKKQKPLPALKREEVLENEGRWRSQIRTCLLTKGKSIDKNPVILKFETKQMIFNFTL